MKLAGRDIGDAVDALYEEIERRLRTEAERGLTVETAEQGALSNISWGDETVIVRLHEGVPTHATPHVFATALQHVRQRLDRYPDVRRPAGDAPAEAGMLRQTLRELVLAPEAEMQIAALELDQDWELEQRHSALKEMLRDPPPQSDAPDSAANKFMALQYARFVVQHPPEMWEGLSKTFRERLPAAAEHGEGVVQVVRKTGWGTPGGCLQSLVGARDELAMRDVAMIEDRRSGELL